MLTPKRSKLLQYIAQYINQHGYAPNLNEMREAMKIKSASGVHVMLCSLEQDGYIVRASHRARSVKLLATPEQIKSIDRPAREINRRYPVENITKVSSPYQKQKTLLSSTDIDTKDDATNIDAIPLMGKIAAGTPIDVISEVIEYLSVPRAMISHQKQYYALKVDGDSMIDAGILPGDVVVICQQEYANDGDIVVALVDQSEATLKYLFQSGQGAILVAANPQYKPVYVEQERLSIQGKISGVLRTY